MGKYEITDQTKIVDGHILHRIKAVTDIGSVKKGSIGGWIESEKNLSDVGDCWIYDDACVYGNGEVSMNAWIADNARVFGNATVSENSCVYNNAAIYGSAGIYGRSLVHDNAEIYDFAVIDGNSEISGSAKIFGNAFIDGSVYIYGNANVHEFAKICTDAIICGDADIATCRNYAVFHLFENVRPVTFFRCSDGEIRIRHAEFYGTIDDFSEWTIRKYGEQSHEIKEFLVLADFVKFRNKNSTI